MNWEHFKLAIPVGTIGGLLAVSTFIGLKGDEFSIFDLSQLSRITNLYIGQFIVTGVAFLVGLKTPAPSEPYNGVDRRKDERRQGGENAQ